MLCENPCNNIVNDNIELWGNETISQRRKRRGTPPAWDVRFLMNTSRIFERLWCLPYKITMIMVAIDLSAILVHDLIPCSIWPETLTANTLPCFFPHFNCGMSIHAIYRAR